MIFRTPEYYNQFKCTAEKCTDNCCIGWEIEIDYDTAAYYKSLGGEFGQRLRENISGDNNFILKGERCPFLNGENLCDVIINCGENRLCQICRDHPRFFEWYGKIKEGGIGLSCEEGARLILSAYSFRTVECEIDEQEEEIDEMLFEKLMSARDYAFSVIKMTDVPIRERICLLLDMAQILQFRLDNPWFPNADIECLYHDMDSDLPQIISLFGEFEPIDGTWVNEYEALKQISPEKRKLSYTEEKYIANILHYFIYRYFLKGVFDGEILSKVKLAVVSAIIIWLMTNGNSDLDTWIEKSKLYSKQMEYSDENRELFYDMTYTHNCFEYTALKKTAELLL